MSALVKGSAVYRVLSVVQLVWPRGMYAVQLSPLSGDGTDGIRVPKPLAELFEPGEFIQITFERT